MAHFSECMWCGKRTCCHSSPRLWDGHGCYVGKDINPRPKHLCSKECVEALKDAVTNHVEYP